MKIIGVQLLITLAFLLPFWVISAGIKSIYQFEFYEVRKELALVLNTNQFKLINETNNSCWVGKPSEITYNIMLSDSTVVSCLCTDGIFQPRLCRKYE